MAVGDSWATLTLEAGLSQTWSHHRAHRFFSHARWSVEQVSAVAARLVVRLAVPGDEAVLVAIDDTLFHRRGPKVQTLAYCIFESWWARDFITMSARATG